MHPFKHFFVFEFKRFLTIRNLIIALLFFATAMYFVIVGVSNFKENQKNKSEFIIIEANKVKRYQYNTQYGALGFRVYYSDSPLCIFFYDSGLFSELNANIDVGERLNIYNSYKGKNLFKILPGIYADFSGFIGLIGSLILIFYGFESLRSTEYIKILTSLLGRRKLYFNIMAARFLLISLFFFLIMLLGFLLVLLNGIVFSLKDYLLMAVFWGIWILVSCFFFCLSTAVGAIRSKLTSKTLLLVIWLCFFYLIPLIVTNIILKISDNISTNYQLEQKKIEQLLNFENRAKKEVGRYSDEKAKTSEGIDIVQSFLENEYKIIQSIEKELEVLMIKNIKIYQWICNFFPSTLFSNIRSEMSCKGFESSIDFFRYIQDLKDKFCLFYFDKEYKSKDTKVESFIKNDENIYNAASRLPGNTGWGILLTIILTVIMFKISYSLFNSGLFALDARGLKDIDDTGITINKADDNIYYSKYVILDNLLFALLSGEQKQVARKGFKGKIRLADTDLGSQSIPGGFFYAPPIESIPGDIKAVDLILLFARLTKLTPDETDAILKHPDVTKVAGKRFENMKKHEKAEILLALSRTVNTNIYFFYDIAVGLDSEFAKKLSNRLKELNAAGKLAFYLTTDDYVRSKKSENTEKKRKGRAKKIYKSKNWTKLVDLLNQK